MVRIHNNNMATSQQELFKNEMMVCQNLEAHAGQHTIPTLFRNSFDVKRSDLVNQVNMLRSLLKGTREGKRALSSWITREVCCAATFAGF